MTLTIHNSKWFQIVQLVHLVHKIWNSKNSMLTLQLKVEEQYLRKRFKHTDSTMDFLTSFPVVQQ